MDGLTLLILALYLLAVMRVTRLINADTILDTPRIWLLRKFGPESTLAYFLSCPWCVSVWVAGISAPFVLWAVGLPLWVWPLLGLATSHLTGLAAQLDGDDLEIEIEDE